MVCLSIVLLPFFLSRPRKPTSVSMEEIIFSVSALAAVLLPRVFPCALCFTALVLAGDLSAYDIEHYFSFVSYIGRKHLLLHYLSPPRSNCH